MSYITISKNKIKMTTQSIASPKRVADEESIIRTCTNSPIW